MAKRTRRKRRPQSKVLVGDHVLVGGVVEHIHQSKKGYWPYAEVRIHDGICGMDTVRITVHQNVIIKGPKV